MEPTPFTLTPEQQGLLASLSRETGKPVSALIAEALEELQEHVHPASPNGDEHGSDEAAPGHDLSNAPPRSASVLDIFRDAQEALPEETWGALPPDLATQHDHYLYGTPKRPA